MGDLVYRCVIAASRAVFRGLGLRIELPGEEHLPTTGGAVLESNHLSFLDFPFLGLVGVERGRLVRFLGKESVFGPPVVGWAMRSRCDRLSGADPVAVTAALRARIDDLLEPAMDTYPAPEIARVLDDAAMWGTGRARRKASSAG